MPIVESRDDRQNSRLSHIWSGWQYICECTHFPIEGTHISTSSYNRLLADLLLAMNAQKLHILFFGSTGEKQIAVNKVSGTCLFRTPLGEECS